MLQRLKTPVRIAFFADIHIQGLSKEGRAPASLMHGERARFCAQTDFGAPSQVIPSLAKQALNQLNPDFIFALGDLTALGSTNDWRAYQHWLQQLHAPVFAVLGNHDRNYCQLCLENKGQGYFQVLGEVADSKALRLGNLIFLLVSEEHNPEGSEEAFTSTIPDKRFAFIERILRTYSHDHNIFILSHTPIAGTTYLSDEWLCNEPKHWHRISQKYLSLMRRYPVAAHLSGHTHIDYRQQGLVQALGAVVEAQQSASQTNASQAPAGSKRYPATIFVNGHQRPDLPPTYFLNMPCVDTAHGWLSGRSTFLRRASSKSYLNWHSLFRKLYFKLETRGPPLWDWLLKSPLKSLLGRSAVYAADVQQGSQHLTIFTRWLEKNRDDRHYQIKLPHPVQLKQRGQAAAKQKRLRQNTQSRYKQSGGPASGSNLCPQLLASDLSLRDHHNIEITPHDWFKVAAGQQAIVHLSQQFTQPVDVNDVKIKAIGLADYQLWVKGSYNQGLTWSPTWCSNYRVLKQVDAVQLKLQLQAQPRQAARVQDIQLVVAQGFSTREF